MVDQLDPHLMCDKGQRCAYIASILWYLAHAQHFAQPFAHIIHYWTEELWLLYHMNTCTDRVAIILSTNSGYIIWFERKNCLTIVSTIQKKKHSYAPVSYERSLYDINVYTPNYSPEQRFEPGKISSTNGRSDRRCE